MPSLKTGKLLGYYKRDATFREITKCLNDSILGPVLLTNWATEHARFLQVRKAMFSKTVEIVEIIEIIEIVEIFGVPEPSIAPTGLRFQSPCGFSVRLYIFLAYEILSSIFFLFLL